MTSINTLKKIYNIIKLELQKLDKKEKVIKFNGKTNNYINSLDVDTENIKGNNITIQEGSAISADTVIGNYTFIGYYTRITKAIIGNYCSIANFVNIADGEHPLETISTSAFFMNNMYEELTKRSCIIGNDVWIGVGCIIRRGVTIGDGAVIGANSFVNKDVLPFSIVAGSPAKFIRKRFTDDKIDAITKSAWWNHPLDEATAILNELEKTK